MPRTLGPAIIEFGALELYTFTVGFRVLGLEFWVAGFKEVYRCRKGSHGSLQGSWCKLEEMEE